MIRPLQHGLDLSHSSLNAPFPYAYWPSKNFKVTQHSAQKRWGYDTADRELGAAVEVQGIILYHQKGGDSFTLFLTDTDLIQKDAGLDTDDWTSIGADGGYTVPDGDRWTWCIVGDRFIFTNGNTDVQSWNNTGDAVALSADLKKAKYCIPYANRLFVAYYGATPDPLGISWSKEGDPTDWTDTTAGAALVETRDFITGLGVVGGSLVIYKTDSIAFGHRTGVATAPVSIPQVRERRGIGCVAPYSIIDHMGTNAFIGRNDFYIIEGDFPKAIGGKIRDKFFDIINLDDIEEVYGWENNITNELCWTANTNEGRLIFAWDYKLREWSVYDFAADFIMAGKGEMPVST